MQAKVFRCLLLLHILSEPSLFYPSWVKGCKSGLQSLPHSLICQLIIMTPLDPLTQPLTCQWLHCSSSSDPSPSSLSWETSGTGTVPHADMSVEQTFTSGLWMCCIQHTAVSMGELTVGLHFCQISFILMVSVEVHLSGNWCVSKPPNMQCQERSQLFLCLHVSVRSTSEAKGLCLYRWE